MRRKGAAPEDIPGIPVRVIEYSVTSACGTDRSETFTLVTDITDPAALSAEQAAGAYARRWQLEVRHLWCGSSRVVLSLLCSLSVAGPGPAGAAVKACRACLALAEPLHFRGVRGDDPAFAGGACRAVIHPR